MIKTVRQPEKSTWAGLCERPKLDVSNLEQTVQSVFEGIKANGDDAVRAYTGRFDHVRLENFELTTDEMAFAKTKVSSELKDAIRLAKENIEIFHESQSISPEKVETTPGVVCWREARPIEKIGIYIPGGSAPLFSTVLMLGVPALIAGCRDIVLCTPPDASGHIAPEIIYTADLLGIRKIFKVGGIQAIAAMTFGTESIPEVYKIFGPGNQYVTAAKQYAQRLGKAIDMPAGPSELMVVADDTAIPDFVAADLLSQAEHGPDSQVVCLTTNDAIARKISDALQRQLAELPRCEIARRALVHSVMLIIPDKGEQLAFANQYAPEHLILCTADNDFFVQNINNAGSVFIGNYSPESAGDYASGTNHTLPTSGYAHMYSGVSLDSFVKKITFQEISDNGIQNIGYAIEKMAAAEQLHAHKNAVSLRLKYLEG